MKEYEIKGAKKGNMYLMNIFRNRPWIELIIFLH
jgi:hypothetical protein